MLLLRALCRSTVGDVFDFRSPGMLLGLPDRYELPRDGTPANRVRVLSRMRHIASVYPQRITCGVVRAHVDRVPRANYLAVDGEARPRLEWLASKQPSLPIAANLNERAPLLKSGVFHLQRDYSTRNHVAITSTFALWRNHYM